MSVIYDAKAHATTGTRLIKPRTRKGKRALERRAPKEVENAKKLLLLFGNSTSQTIKDVLSDLKCLKGRNTQKYARNNPDVKPFEPGGEVPLEHFCRKSDCSLFALGNHTKKRPHNLTLGRLYDSHLYDAIEFGVEGLTTIKEFGSAQAQYGNKPCMIFIGDKFESDVNMRHARSLLMDMFRGETVEHINLAGLDRVLVVVALDESHLLLHHYLIKLKKSGTKVPRIQLEEMGPSLSLVVRRTRAAAPDVEKEALKKLEGKKKVKNVGRDLLDGKVGRIYVPKQDVNVIGLAKMRGLKRERRMAAAETKNATQGGAKKQKRGEV